MTQKPTIYLLAGKAVQDKYYIISQDETSLLFSNGKAKSHSNAKIQYYIQRQSTSPEDGTPSSDTVSTNV